MPTDVIASLWPQFLALLTFVVSVLAAGHAILYKRDTRAAIAWVGFIWFVPIFGSLLYLWLGINRVHRRARSLRDFRHLLPVHSADACVAPEAASIHQLGPHLTHLARLVGKVTRYPLLDGNTVTPLAPEEAYPRMLDAIAQAQRSITLGTYIFDNDAAGRRFADALRNAVQRGVQVRVMVDDAGSKYTFPPITYRMRRAGISHASFLPQWAPWAFAYANLRNHRKILVVDGARGFIGGMNIRSAHWPALCPKNPITDLHFQVNGPVVTQMQHAFAEDWLFCKGERLEGDIWFPEVPSEGDVIARGIPDGPDADFENLCTTLLGALSCAESSVRVVTPYFLPNASLITALNLAAMRGVKVDIFLPARNNLRLVQWASAAIVWQVLEQGCRIWLTPPPFDHTKLMLVDGAWTLLGSSNWDPRSLRLNFEFNLECYDPVLAATLDTLVERKRSTARPLTLEDVDGRSLAVKLRDGCARLASPYL
ncbi:phospholipase D-like domain-containing protein [Desulfatitalea alkaliphila]|uniref:Phospholipase D-like domain-containing protein n=1 Tax=Desulfatitalea alkaliphila TaxID=2929485 RepID=A0AA41R6T3_9BACT|nr:phospholipase D-like domain-containing protein [Desulfatitalea alkaliphila]